jgi:hypothetical protein
VFPARYELNSYIVYRKRLVSKRLTLTETDIQILAQGSSMNFVLNKLRRISERKCVSITASREYALLMWSNPYPYHIQLAPRTSIRGYEPQGQVYLKFNAATSTPIFTPTARSRTTYCIHFPLLRVTACEIFSRIYINSSFRYRVAFEWVALKLCAPENTGSKLGQ